METNAIHYVTYEVRKQGAIGIFYPQTVPIHAHPEAGDESLRTSARNEFNRLGYETRNPIRISRGSLPTA